MGKIHRRNKRDSAEGYVAASNGRFLGTALNGDGTITWHWKEGHQIATYMMCATVSKFTNPVSNLTVAPGDTIRSNTSRGPGTPL